MFGLRLPPPPSNPRSDPTRLRYFASSLRELAARQEVDETLQLVVDLAPELMRGCDYADVMFVRAGGSTTPASSHPTARALDRAQDETGEGPCLAAAREHDVVVVDDFRDDGRWPSFAARAMEHGISSAVSYQLYIEGESRDRLGALNLYGTRPRAFDAVSVELGEVFAAHCSAVLLSAIDREGSQAALASRDVIGQAKGILMSQHGVDADEAFNLLRRTSQDTNVKLRDLAQQVAETGRLEFRAEPRDRSAAGR